MTCIGKVSADKVLLPPGIHLPDGAEVEVRMAEPNSRTAAPGARPRIKKLPDFEARFRQLWPHGPALDAAESAQLDKLIAGE